MQIIPFIVHEADMARLERTNKRLWIALILVLLLLVGTNAAWAWYENQFIEEVTTIEQTVDTGNGNAFVSGMGDVNYGESAATNNDQKQSS